MTKSFLTLGPDLAFTFYTAFFFYPGQQQVKRSLDKREYVMIMKVTFTYFSSKPYVVPPQCAHLNIF